MSKNKWIWVLVSVLIAGLSIWAVISQSASFTVEDFRTFIIESDKKWLIGALLSMFGFIFFEGLAVKHIASALGYRRNIFKGTVYGAADVYFSAITPSASGGQPASAYFMLQDGIPATVITVTLITNLIMYTLALLFVGIICSIFRFDIVLQMGTLSKVLIFLGTIILILIAIAFYMLLKRPLIFKKICSGLLLFLEKIHIVKNGNKYRKKLEITMLEYKECSEIISGKISMLWCAFFLNLLQRLSQFFVGFFVFLAKGRPLKEALDVFVTQCFVTLGSNCIPIPGAMGVADYIMMDGYKNIVGEQLATYMELLSRGISFYGCMIISAFIVIIAFVVRRWEGKKC